MDMPLSLSYLPYPWENGSRGLCVCVWGGGGGGRDGSGRTSEVIFVCMTLGVMPVLLHVDVHVDS